MRVEMSSGKRRSDRGSSPRQHSSMSQQRVRGSPVYDDYHGLRKSR